MGEERLDIGDDDRLKGALEVFVSILRCRGGRRLLIALRISARDVAAAWLATGGASLMTLGGGAAEDPLPARIGKTEIGFRWARVCWVTRLLPLSEMWHKLCGNTAVTQPLQFQQQSCLLLN